MNLEVRVEDSHFHDLRHLGTTRLLKGGGTNFQIMKNEGNLAYPFYEGKGKGGGKRVAR
jgi:hypothetical protein